MKRLSIVAAACGVVFGILVLLKSGFRTEARWQSNAEKRQTSTLGTKNLATPRAENVTGPSNRDKVDEVRRVIEAANVPINFWGRVTDQDGLPLAGVAVSYTCSIDHGNDQGVAWIQEESQQGEVQSGGDGLFGILGLKGHDLTIESLTKPYYVYKTRFNRSYNFYGDAPSGKFISDPGKPIAFAMIHKDRLEALVRTKGTLHVVGDEIPGRWNIWSGEADPSGELAVTFRADPGVSAIPAQIVNWSADLEVVGGGISEAPWEEEIRRAPESGYLATAGYSKVDQKKGVPHRSFYLRTADGKYGRIEVELSTSHDGRTARCYIICDMNPQPGSRNLESKEDE